MSATTELENPDADNDREIDSSRAHSCSSSKALWAALVAATLAQARTAAPTVSAPAGTFAGNTSIQGLDQFLGIPYANPPTGALRFANPEPFNGSLSKPYNATAYGPGCLQNPLYGLYNGLSEDCLTVNVVRPHNLTASSKLPVLVWIHGGGNENGQSLFYNGTALVQYSVSIDQPVIYVAFNYRLGGFGFMTSPATQARGLSNLGLKDQYLALQWVHKNIGSFGGNSSQVIIFGESAGAWDCWAQLHHAYTLNETNKYFHGMITQSGSPGALAAPFALPPAAGAPAYQNLLSQTNCSAAADSVACLRKAPVDVLSPILTAGSIIQFTLDDDWFSKNLTESLIDYELAPIPIVHGCNLDEGSVFMPDPFSPPNRTDLIDLISPYLNNSETLAARIVSVYENTSAPELGKGFNADPSANHSYWTAVGLYSDVWMHLGRRALLRKASAHVPTWGYSFDQQPPLSQMNLSYEYPGLPASYARRVAVQHGAELSYVFGEATSLDNRTQGDVAVSTTMMRSWISFAYTLDPNPADGEDVPYWPHYNDTEEGVVMVFQHQGGQVIAPSKDTMRQKVYDAWNSARETLGLVPIY
ncbi:hypothetical protein LTR96_003067 [Exophiala xenobiotica]|nr:hypothetical protein LTR96_003067 [Exophiala xenobiotica]KAK5342478.1 hypothetical protein LTR98_000103 [Exophiala xenobiotica]